MAVQWTAMTESLLYAEGYFSHLGEPVDALAASDRRRWASFIMLDVNHGRRYYIIT